MNFKINIDNNTNFNSPLGVRGSFLLLLLFCFQIGFALSPKREMRATWLATVFRIDWPGSTIAGTGNLTQINSQKQDMIRILDSLASANMNAVFFQVRSRCDAMYKSSYEPWSTDLVQYRGYDPGYDPLAFTIEEAHKRGIELHAWLNPYRYETALNQWTGQPGDYRTEHPDWLLTYSNGISILDPGRPQVVKRIKDIIGEIVTNYNVDGIMFDDYFYAYGGTSATLDAATQALYKPANMDIGDWRRANVNRMIAEVYDTIQDVKPYVRFGVSPFGIWTTNQAVAAKEDLVLPSGITGSDMYASIYCDPVAWMKEKSVDYISPQLYWPTGGSQDYSKLCPWWSNVSNRFGRHFYSSQDIASLQTSSYAPRKKIAIENSDPQFSELTANESAASTVEKLILSKISKANAGGFTQEQIGLQISINRSSDENNAPGSIFFSTKQLYQTKGFINYLKKYQFTQKALMPVIDWKPKAQIGLLTGLTLTNKVLSWNSTGSNLKYAIYSVPNDKMNQPNKFGTSEFLIGISYSNSFTLPQALSTTTNTFAVSALDKLGNEFPIAILNQPTAQVGAPTLNYPANNQNVILPFTFTWSAVSGVDNYLLEIAEDANFNTIKVSREISTTEISTSKLDFLESDKKYYWRVKSRKANSEDATSAIRSFTSVEFKITSPLSGSVDVSLTPQMTWQAVNVGNTYLLEIATNNQFTTNAIIYSTSVTTNMHTLPAKKLVGNTIYFARVTTTINSISTSSKVVTFTTKSEVPSVPTFSSPTNNATVFGTEIKLVWTEDVPASYRVEMANDLTFPVRNTTVKTLVPFVTNTVFEALSPADYYFRIRAEYSGSLTTAWSPTLKVTLNANTSLDFPFENGAFFQIYRTSIGYRIVLLKSASDKTLFTLYNSTGQKMATQVKQSSTVNSEYNLETNELESGIYILQIQNGLSYKSIKIYQ